MPSTVVITPKLMVHMPSIWVDPFLFTICTIGSSTQLQAMGSLAYKIIDRGHMTYIDHIGVLLS